MYGISTIKKILFIKNREKWSIRKTAERFCISPNTVFKWNKGLMPKSKRTCQARKLDMEELKENVEKNTTNEELNTQSKENKNADQANEENNLESGKKEVENLSPEEELETLKDKLARTFAEMENQRRRFEKERDDNSLDELCIMSPF